VAAGALRSIAQRGSPVRTRRRATGACGVKETEKSRKPYSVVGGVIQPYRGEKRWARLRLSWPLARLELRENEIRLAPRGVLRRVFPTLILPHDEITGAERVAGRTSPIADGIRFRSMNEELDGIVFSTLQPNARRLQDRLRASGIDIEER
jgi:hypothetical protein